MSDNILRRAIVRHVMITIVYALIKFSINKFLSNLLLLYGGYFARQ